MATDLERLVVSLEASITKYEKTLAKASGVANSTASGIERRFQKMNTNVNRSFQNALKSSAAMLGIGLGINELRQLTDTWTDLSSRVNLAAGSMDAGAAVMGRLSEMARRTYSGLEQTAESYLLNASALTAMGYSTQTQLDYTEALNNALVVSGAKGDRARSVMEALSKAMALGKLSGENLNTVISTGGRVAEALAASMGVNVTQLRQLGKDGKITRKELIGITSQLGKLREEADGMQATIGDAMVLLKNSLLEYVGTADHASGVSAALSNGIILLADNLGSVADAAAAAGVVMVASYGRVAVAQAAMIATNPFLLLVSAIAAATFALSAFGDEITPIAGDLANLQDYAGSAWDAIRDGVLDTASVIKDNLLVAINYIADAISGTEVTWGDVMDFIKGAINGLVGNVRGMAEIVAAIFGKLPAAIAEGVISAMNSMVDVVERALQKVAVGVDAVISAINSASSSVGGPTMAPIGDVELGRVRNKYKGAGEALGKALTDGIDKTAFGGNPDDYLGKVGDSWRKAANDRAQSRAIENTEKARRDALKKGGISIVDKPINLPDDTKKKGGGQKKTAQDRLNEDIQRVKDRTAALAEEARITGLTFQEQEKRRMALDLEQSALAHLREEARKKGVKDLESIQLSPAQVAAIDAASEAYARQAEALRQVQEAQGRAEQAAQEFYDTFKSGMISATTGAQSLKDALIGVLNKLAEMVLNSAFDKLFNGATGSGGWLTNIFGAMGWADGGYTGPGGKNDPAGIVHKGEYVFSKKAVDKIGAGNLEAMHRNLKGYATGGLVGAPTMPRLQAPANQNAPTTTDVRVFVDQNGNWHAAVERISQRNVKAGLAKYDKGGTYRASRDLREAGKRGYV